MGALTSVACTSCLLSARSSGILRIGRAFGLAIARLRRSAGFVAVATVLRHLRHIGLAVLVGRLRLQGGFSIFAWVRGHVIWRMRSAFVSGQARGSYPRRSLLPDRPRFGAAPARGCYLDPVRGALEGTQSGKECSSSAAVEIAFVPSWQARVGACVEVSQVGARSSRVASRPFRRWNATGGRGWARSRVEKDWKGSSDGGRWGDGCRVDDGQALLVSGTTLAR